MAIILHGANGARTVNKTQTMNKREPENVKAPRAEGNVMMVVSTNSNKSENVVRIFFGQKM